MKRLIAVLAGLLIMPAFAEVVPDWYYEDTIEYTDDFAGDEVYIDDEIIEAVQPTAPIVTVQPSVAAGRATTNQPVQNRAAVTRVVPSSNAVTTTSSRTTTARPVSSRTAATTSRAGRAGTTGTTSRATTTSGTASQGVTTRRTTPATTTNAARASVTTSDTVNTPIYTGRVGVRTPTTSMAAGTRASTTRIATSTNLSTATTSVADTTATLDELAQLTDFCRAQYTQCMDNFCNVLDDNEGRCSCSANLKNYSKTEEGLKKATEELQEVASKIQYIGLTKDEIETLFSQTEAEAAMQGRTDSTQLSNDLNRLKNLIIDVKTGSAVATDAGLGLDLSGLLDFSFDSTGFDLGSLFGNTSSASSISNQRGAELYKTATARCKTSVIDNCRAQGVDTAIITNAYDLEIDKQCIIYERSLSDANTQMTQTVRNAKSVLQKARLVVAQQKNSYDLRGCINALDSCMQDDFVCGNDYENCLDPSGKYIVNGAVVIGSEPGQSGGTQSGDKFTAGLYTAWNYGATNAWSSKTDASAGTVAGFIEATIKSGTQAPSTVPTNMVEYLQQKIGYVDSSSRSLGMCVSILNKCQDYTYTGSNKTFNGKNDVTIGYMQRTLIQIKSAQDEVLSRYAEQCISNVASCLSTNGYSTTQVSQNAAKNSCKAVIRTCVSTTGNTEDDVILAAVGGYTCPANSVYSATLTATAPGSSTTYGAVEATPAGGFCRCNYVGVVSGGLCPVS